MRRIGQKGRVKKAAHILQTLRVPDLLRCAAFEPEMTVTDVAGVQAAGDRGVCGPFDDSTAIGEQRDFVGLAEKLENEFVVTDPAERGESGADFGEIDRALRARGSARNFVRTE